MEIISVVDLWSPMFNLSNHCPYKCQLFYIFWLKNTSSWCTSQTFFLTLSFNIRPKIKRICVFVVVGECSCSLLIPINTLDFNKFRWLKASVIILSLVKTASRISSVSFYTREPCTFIIVPGWSFIAASRGGCKNKSWVWEWVGWTRRAARPRFTHSLTGENRGKAREWVENTFHALHSLETPSYPTLLWAYLRVFSPQWRKVSDGGHSSINTWSDTGLWMDRKGARTVGGNWRTRKGRRGDSTAGWCFKEQFKQ